MRSFFQDRHRWVPGSLLVAFVMISSAIHLYHLGHYFIGAMDEPIHAVVAQNAIKDPLSPTLYHHQWEPADSSDWTKSHVWLHIMPFGMWVAGCGIWLLGDTPFAVRLPGVGFVLLGMLASYFLGRRLFGTRTAGSLAGLTGAFFVGFAPLGVALAQGYGFGDITDTPLLGLTPVMAFAAVRGWQTGSRRWLALAGLVQTTLYLTKGALGLAPLAIVVALFLADLVFDEEAGWCRPGWRGLGVFLGTTVATTAPFYLYFSLSFPKETRTEGGSWKKAFFENYEQWGAPVDHHFTLYFFLMYGTSLALLIVTAVGVCGHRALFRRSRGDLVLFTYFIAVFLPLSIAVTKSPPMTIPAVAGAGLAVGRLIDLVATTRSRILRAAGIALVTSTALLCAGSVWGGERIARLLRYDLSPSTPNPTGNLYTVHPPDRFDPYFVLGGATIALTAMFLLLSWAARRLRRPGSSAGRRITTTGLVVACLLMAGYVLRLDIRYVTRPETSAGIGPEFGSYVDRLAPEGATVFVDNSQRPSLEPTLDHLSIMFWTKRDTFLVDSSNSGEVCAAFERARRFSSPAILVTWRAGYSGPGTAIGTINGWYLTRLEPCPS